MFSDRSSLAISVRHLGKTYRIRDVAPPTSMAEALRHRVRHGRSKMREFHALSDLSFELSAGQALGVIGRNGAGKSTLLKMLTRVTAPTTGDIDLYGRVGSLLEVGTGFHPELTGRENIYLSGSVLGMRKSEIELAFDDIVSFAMVEKFIDTPVKRYSSGMYVRLAFAVAAHLPSEILLIDEVLAVGDAAFRAKSIDRMKQITKSGRSVVFVSHHMPTITELCETAIVLDDGRKVFEGSPSIAAGKYLDSLSSNDLSSGVQRNRRGGTGELRLASFVVEKPSCLPDEAKRFHFAVDHLNDYPGEYSISVFCSDEIGNRVFHVDSRLMDVWFDGSRSASGIFEFSTPWLQPGRYSFEVVLVGRGESPIDVNKGAAHIDVLPVLPYPVADSGWSATGLILADCRWDAQRGRALTTHS